ncbi:hypothetical protein [Algoriphagus sp.]|uniref:hypothetical protein n=1 Tax=Algoriphagus sp. TaxID=1872435 RepID=UPI00327B702F
MTVFALVLSNSSLKSHRVFFTLILFLVGVPSFGSQLLDSIHKKESWVQDTLIDLSSTVKVERITASDGQYWFGYYDKLQTDPSGRYVLGMKVDSIFRSPTAEDTLRIGIIDLENGNKWEEIGTSTAWGWQQGCMLQWIPGSDEEVIWNDRENGAFISRVFNVKTGENRTLPKPIYALSPDGTFAVGTEFNRIQNMRPGYGYPGIADPYINEKAPAEIGIYKMDLKTGESNMIISLAEIAEMPNAEGKIDSKYFHYFNHLLVSPDSKRLVFLHRYKTYDPKVGSTGGGFITRMITANVDGSDIYLLDPSGFTSHFIWKNSDQITAWTKPAGRKEAFYRFTDKTDQVEIVGEYAMPVNGHNTYVPNTNYEWIINDSYPQGEDRLQILYLYHVTTNKKVVVGNFYEPAHFKGEWRCDLHPRVSQNGDYLIFDSTHEGGKRSMYKVEIGFIKEM